MIGNDLPATVAEDPDGRHLFGQVKRFFAFDAAKSDFGIDDDRVFAI